MAKRAHHDIENDAESGLIPAKRFTPLNTESSDTEASKHLQKLSNFLGLEDLKAEDGPQSLLATPFIGTLILHFPPFISNQI